jgi:hypothetical protein
VEAQAFMQAAKKRMMFAIYAMSITESVKGLEALPTYYKEYQDVFERRMFICFLNTVCMIAQLISKKVLNRHLDQSIIFISKQTCCFPRLL